jgi:hypothetical protein
MFLVTITLLMTTVLGQDEQDGEQQQWLTYESHFGYSIQYPSDWEALEEPITHTVAELIQLN